MPKQLYDGLLMAVVLCDRWHDEIQTEITEI